MTRNAIRTSLIAAAWIATAAQAQAPPPYVGM